MEKGSFRPTDEYIDLLFDLMSLERTEAQIVERLGQDPNAFDPDGPTRTVGTSLDVLFRMRAIFAADIAD